MAKAKQNTELKVPSKDKATAIQSKSSVFKNKVPAAVPLKITIEVVIRNESAQDVKPLGTPLPDLGEATTLGNCPDNQFTYTFEKENATIDYLTVENYEQDNPSDSGSFTTCINNVIAGEAYVLVLAKATKNNPGGRAALTLKFRGENVFSAPVELSLQPNGSLRFAKSVKLPRK
ncbi:MAG: hypothetical protein Q8K92_26445 [Leadbetterella sp.]|nr:hypothetical protein [Leadbetterella sp.]